MWERCWVRQGGGRRDTSEWTDGCRQLHLLGRGAEGADTQVDAGQLWEVPHLLPERGRRRPCCAGMRRRRSGTTTALVSPGAECPTRQGSHGRGAYGYSEPSKAGPRRKWVTESGRAVTDAWSGRHRRRSRDGTRDRRDRGVRPSTNAGAVRWSAPPDTGFRRFDRVATPGRACRRPAAAGSRAPPVHAVPRKRAASLPPRRAAAPVRAACPGRRAPRRR